MGLALARSGHWLNAGEIEGLSAQLASTEAVEGSLATANIRAHIGNVGPGAQIALGSRIIQIQAAAGAVGTVAAEPAPPPVRRPPPAHQLPPQVHAIFTRPA